MSCHGTFKISAIPLFLISLRLGYLGGEYKCKQYVKNGMKVFCLSNEMSFLSLVTNCTDDSDCAMEHATCDSDSSQCVCPHTHRGNAYFGCSGMHF